MRVLKRLRFIRRRIKIFMNLFNDVYALGRVLDLRPKSATFDHFSDLNINYFTAIGLRRQHIARIGQLQEPKVLACTYHANRSDVKHRSIRTDACCVLLTSRFLLRSRLVRVFRERYYNVESTTFELDETTETRLLILLLGVRRLYRSRSRMPSSLS